MYRVDLFYAGKHVRKFFETEKAAREFATGKEGIGFLTKEISDGVYEIVEELR